MSHYRPRGRAMFAQGDDASAKVVLYGMPYDGTTSFRPGTRFGPEGVRQATYGLETYSPIQDAELPLDAITDMGDLDLPVSSVEAVLARIEEAVDAIDGRGQFPFGLGGEHLVTLGTIRSLARRHKDLCILQFDAHTDWRQEFLGSSLSHATVMKRCQDILGPHSIFQFGIRSGTKEEFETADFLSRSLEALPRALEEIGSRPVFLTFDVDGFDPFEAPGTGTPEPGGFTWNDLEPYLAAFQGKMWVGADIVEVAPGLDLSGRTEVLAAKLLRELLIIFARGTSPR